MGFKSITKCSWLGAGVLEDISARLHCYKADWADGIASGFRFCLIRQCLSLMLVAHSTQTIASARLAYILAQSDSNIVQLLLNISYCPAGLSRLQLMSSAPLQFQHLHLAPRCPLRLVSKPLCMGFPLKCWKYLEHTTACK